jgi:hypothetical protein
MDYDRILRQLAQNSYWQNLYEASKENAGIYLFLNQNNFSSLQVRFMYWLSVYSLLYGELMKHEDKLLTEKVIHDNDRCDAYLIRRHKKQDALWENYRRDEKVAEIKSRHPNKHKSGQMNVIDVDLRSE